MSAPTGLAAFPAVLRAPHAAALVGTSLLGRLNFAMWPLGLVLFVEERTGSFATAGAVSAAGTLAVAVGTPTTSRLVDRLGASRVLVGCTGIHLAGALALVLLGLSGASPVVLAGAALLAGLAAPPLSPTLRGVWSDVLTTEQLRTGLALDALVIEGVFVGGPLLAALTIGLASPAALLVLTVACTVSGTLLFAALAPVRARGPSARRAGALGPLAAPGLRTMLIPAVAIGICVGALEVALPAFADAEGAANLAGLAFAAQAAGSAAGGLVYGARAQGRDLRGLYLLLLAVLPPSVALLALADSLVTLLVFAALSGVVIAPFTAAENELAGEVAPEGTVSEAYAWMIVAVVVGVALGNATAGVLVEGAGWRVAVLVPCGLFAASALVAFARRDTLRPLTE